MRTIAIGRLIGLLLAVSCTVLAVVSAGDALRLNALFHEWVVAIPMEATVDLSQPGEFSTPFRQTCEVAHGEPVILKCDQSSESPEEFAECLDCLSGLIEIRDSRGAIVAVVKFEKETIRRWGKDIAMTWINDKFPSGEYVATIRVESGVPSLAGMPQTVVAKYKLCGLEQLTAMITGLVAIVLGVLGIVSGVVLVPRLLRHGIWHVVSTESP